MIQPIKSAKNTWFLYWLDLDEPIEHGNVWILPTLVIVCDRAGVPLSAPEILPELDQDRVESYLYKLIETLSAPDRLTIAASPDWDDQMWVAFAAECKVDIRFQSFESTSTQELKTLASALTQRVGPSAQNLSQTSEISRALVRTAQRMQSPSKRTAVLRKALERDPECCEARIELADLDFQGGSWKACLEQYEEIIHRQEGRWSGPDVPWWVDYDTRPYLRAVYGRAMTQWHLGRYTLASRTLEDLLRTNPTDNQGARFLIPMLYLLSESNDRAAAFFVKYAEAYPGDYAEPAFAFGWGLSLSLEGRELEARQKYVEGILKNVHIVPLLLEQELPSESMWMPSDRADASYAEDFIDSYAVLWDREPGALRILREVYAELAPRIEKINQHRSHMADFQDQRYEPDYKEIWHKLIATDEALMRP